MQPTFGPFLVGVELLELELRATSFVAFNAVHRDIQRTGTSHMDTNDVPPPKLSKQCRARAAQELPGFLLVDQYLAVGLDSSHGTDPVLG